MIFLFQSPLPVLSCHFHIIDPGGSKSLVSCHFLTPSDGCALTKNLLRAMDLLTSSYTPTSSLDVGVHKSFLIASFDSTYRQHLLGLFLRPYLEALTQYFPLPLLITLSPVTSSFTFTRKCFLQVLHLLIIDLPAVGACQSGLFS